MYAWIVCMHTLFICTKQNSTFWPEIIYILCMHELYACIYYLYAPKTCMVSMIYACEYHAYACIWYEYACMWYAYAWIGVHMHTYAYKKSGSLTVTVSRLSVTVENLSKSLTVTVSADNHCQWAESAIEPAPFLTVTVSHCQWLSVIVSHCQWLSVTVSDHACMHVSPNKYSMFLH